MLHKNIQSSRLQTWSFLLSYFPIYFKLTIRTNDKLTIPSLYWPISLPLAVVDKQSETLAGRKQQYVNILQQVKDHIATHNSLYSTPYIVIDSISTTPYISATQNGSLTFTQENGWNCSD